MHMEQLNYPILANGGGQPPLRALGVLAEPPPMAGIGVVEPPSMAKMRVVETTSKGLGVAKLPPRRAVGGDRNHPIAFGGDFVTPFLAIRVTKSPPPHSGPRGGSATSNGQNGLVFKIIFIFFRTCGDLLVWLMEW